MLTKIAGLSAEERARGLVAASAGNHAQALAWAAAALGMPGHRSHAADRPRRQAGRDRGYGGTVVFEPSFLPSQRATRWSPNTARPSSRPSRQAVIAGQGTVGLEILDDLPDVARWWSPSAGAG